jgi:signal peptide peptidase SppA
MPDYLRTIAWALEPTMLTVVDEILSARFDGRERDLAAIEARLGRPLVNEHQKPYRVVDGVAVIEAAGVLGKRMNLLAAMSGGVSTQQLQEQLEDALTDPAVVAVVLSLDSPGGTVDGTAELGDWLLAQRGVKPLFAYADGTMASGAYWLGAACDRIVAYRTARVGSVACVLTHYDRSGADAKAGIKRTFIASGDYKRLGNDAEPLNEKAYAYLRESVDRYHQMFIEAVAAGRGISVEEAQDRFGDGRVHLADAALAIGMIDSIGSLADTIDAARRAAEEEQEMPTMTKAELAEKQPELHDALIEEGRQAARAETEAAVNQAVAAERERLCGVYGTLHGEQAQAGFAQLADSGTTVAQLQALAAVGFNRQPAAGAAAAGSGGADNAEARQKAQILAGLKETDAEVSAGGAGSETFLGLVDALVEEKRVTRTEAMKRIAAQRPDLHQAYLAGERK